MCPAPGTQFLDKSIEARIYLPMLIVSNFVYSDVFTLTPRLPGSKTISKLQIMEVTATFNTRGWLRHLSCFHAPVRRMQTPTRELAPRLQAESFTQLQQL